MALRHYLRHRTRSDMFSRLAVITVLAALPGLCQDWSPRLAAEYLDSRQKEWFAWPRAKAEGGPCVSCHTGITYLLARPALRRALGESQPTPYEIGLVEGLRARLGVKDESVIQGVNAISSALFVKQADPTQAFERLWSFQVREGKAKGAPRWYSANLDPWETPDSTFYGAALAALAVGSAPAEYRDRPEIRERVNALTGYLQREQPAQPLHSRLALLWASSKLPAALPEPMRQPIIDEVLRAQQADGGWTIESLGPWRPHPGAPSSAGSNSYATGFVAFIVQEAGVARSHPRLIRALDWLKSKQDRNSGYWAADSMNKQFPADSMERRFMQDAATAFATLALLESGAGF